MSKSAESLSTFLLHFLERLNDYESIEKKVMGSLTDICDYCGFKRGFVYQTDGFRYFYLKETVGNEDNTLRSRFEMGEMTKQHLARAKDKKEPFCVDGHEGSSLADIDIMDFYKVKSLLIRHFEDTEGKIIGFIGFADREEGASSFTKEESQAIYLALGALSKEISIREYKEREVRASKTLGSIMNNMGVDIYVNSFDSHDMLYANESMAAPYGGIEHFEGKKCWQALYTDKTGECEFCPKRHLIDENGLPTKVYSWDYQRPFDGSWFRVFSAAFRWVDGRLAHVVSSADITDNKRNEALVEYLANYDSLTNLPNRRMLVKECERRIDKTQEGGEGYLLFFDIDGFKKINDTFGHEAGDEFLVQLGQFFSGIPLLHDAIYRNGGDEFIAIIDGDKTEANIRNLASFIHRRFAQPWRLKRGEVFCNVSIGVARYPEDGRTAEELLLKADQAMYKVKKAGGKGVLFGYEL